MTTYLVSRHPASVEWIEQQGFTINHFLNHFDDTHLTQLKPGDIVMGILPMQIVADINQKGAHYYHLTLNIPFEYRGKELTQADLIRFGATLTEYQVKKIKEITQNAKIPSPAS